MGLMNRRQLLMGVGGAAFLAGCRRPDPAPGVADLSQDFITDRQRLRDEWRAKLQAAPALDTKPRTTPKPPLNFLTEFPELKSLTKAAVRLHPRFGEEPNLLATKFGGKIAWPAAEPWPHDVTANLSMVFLLQVRADDAPSQWKFPAGKNLVQIFLTPIYQEPNRVNIQLIWKNLKDLEGIGPVEPPASANSDPGLLPFECRLFPERVLEFPDRATILGTGLRDRLMSWHVPKEINHTPPLSGIDFYTRNLSSSPGTKIGGYDNAWPTSPTAVPPTCTTCGWGMEYLLSIAERDWPEADVARWKPLGDEATFANARATGLQLGERTLRVFQCQRCVERPARCVVA